MQTFLPLGIMVGVVFGAFFFALLLNRILAPRKHGGTSVKSAVFECGNLIADQGERKRHIGFYLIAIDFVLFDVELAFFYPWAVVFRQLKPEALLFGSIFLMILVIGFIYVWKSGAIELE